LFFFFFGGALWLGGAQAPPSHSVAPPLRAGDPNKLSSTVYLPIFCFAIKVAIFLINGLKSY